MQTCTCDHQIDCLNNNKLEMCDKSRYISSGHELNSLLTQSIWNLGLNTSASPSFPPSPLPLIPSLPGPYLKDSE